MGQLVFGSFILISLFGFSQSPQKTIDSLYAINKFHEAALYIEDAGLKKTPGFRYYYFEARRRSDLIRSFNADMLMEELFPNDWNSNEYKLSYWTMKVFVEGDYDEPSFDFEDFLEENELKKDFKAEIYLIVAMSELFGENGVKAKGNAYLDSCIQLKPNLRDVNLFKYIATKTLQLPDSMYDNSKSYYEREKELFPLNPVLAYANRRFRLKDSDKKWMESYYWAYQSSPQESRYLEYLLEAIGKDKAKKFLKENIHFEHSTKVFELYQEYGMNEEKKFTTKRLIQINESKLQKDSTDNCAMHDLIEPYFEMGNYQKVAYFGDKLKKAGLASNKTLQFLAKAYYNLGEYNNALQVCLEELNKNSRVHGFYTIAADVFIQKKQYDKAFRYLRVGEDKTDFNGYFTEARHYAILFEHC